MGLRWRAMAILLLALFGVVAARPARAQIGSDRYSSIIIDAATGNILSAVNADEPRYPASLTKLMTLYVTFEALRDHRIALSDLVPVSARAAAMSPSKLGLTPATRITVEQAVLGLVTKSANDAAAALGELLGGDEDRFAAMMTLRARALGMAHTTFRNASGLPDPDQVSTARDLALLARHIVTDFPTYYGYFSTRGFVWHGRMIPNHDHMLDTYPGADGMKTGYTVLAGHNLVTSAQRSGVRLIGVVLGAASNSERDIHMAALLDQGFERMNVAPVGPAARRGWMMARLSGVFTTAAHAAPLPAPEPTARTALARVAGTALARVAAPARRAPAVTEAAAPAGARWLIMVGLYANQREAREAALDGRHAAADGAPRVAPAGGHGHKLWLAEVVGLTGSQAQTACAVLARHHIPCAARRADPGQYASR
jgi:D-alanyl-D-alanine carboxypeptidase